MMVYECLMLMLMLCKSSYARLTPEVLHTPMETNGNLDSDASGNMVDQKLYRSMIGSLLYVIASRLDVMFSVCICARF